MVAEALPCGRCRWSKGCVVLMKWWMGSSTCGGAHAVNSGLELTVTRFWLAGLQAWLWVLLSSMLVTKSSYNVCNQA